MARTDESNLEGADKKPAYPLHRDGYSIADYRKIVRLGEGTFGEVWKAERGGLIVALKILKASMSSDETQRELKSLETLKKLHHKFLLRTDNFWSDGDRLFIEMELAEGGTLKERLKAYQAAGKEGVPEDELLKYFTEAAKALDYLHGHRPVFLHRDIKPANILLVQGCAKLADFGLLRQVTGDNTSTKTQGGTPVYMAPESIKEDKFSVHTDLFSFAVAYAELRQGKLPFLAKTQFQIYQKICQDPPELSDIFHPEERRVLLKALEKDPDQRFSSCGEFVFELNRVVPWVPAVEVPNLPAPLHSASSTSETEELKSGEPKVEGAPEFGTARKRSPVTMAEIDLPAASDRPSAPTAKKDDGTVVNKKGPSAGKATTSPPKKDPKTDPTAPGGTGQTGTGSQSKLGQSTGKRSKSSPSFAPAHAQIAKRGFKRVVFSAMLIAIVGGIGYLVIMAMRTAPDEKRPGPKPPEVLSADAVAIKVDQALEADDLSEARKVVEKNLASLADGGKELNAKIEKRAKVTAVLIQAEELLKKKDLESCLGLLAKSETPFPLKKDRDRKNRIFESARDALHQRLVNEVRVSLKAGATQPVRDKLDTLAKFRKEYPKADWTPDFQELPFPAGLLSDAWKSLLADKVVAADARRRVQKVKEYANPAQPDEFVLDPLYEKNVRALEALVKANEANNNGANEAVADLLAVLRSSSQPGELNVNLWLGLAQLENRRGLFRFEDLDALGTIPVDDKAHPASAQIFTHVLERLIQKDNYQWLPSDSQMAKILPWSADRIGKPSDVLKALKAESLVRTGAKPEALDAIAFPLKADWYGGYVHALVTSKKKPEDAADILVSALKVKPKVVLNPPERGKTAAQMLRSAVGTLARTGQEPKGFVSDKDAQKALVWLLAILDFEDAAGRATLGDLGDLAFAAVKSDTPDTGDALNKVADRVNQMDAASKVKGYGILAKAYRAELDLAGADAKKNLLDKAIQKSKRAQSFAYDSKKILALDAAADLNARAVEVEARATFAKAKDGKAKYNVFDAALKKANAQKPADGFSLPVMVAKLEATPDFSKDDIRVTIKEGRVALEMPLPAQKWWQDLRGVALVRFADAQQVLIDKMFNTKEPFKNDAERDTMLREMLKSYQEARKAGGYKEKYQGELPFKIGAKQFLLENYPEAHKELKEGRKKLAEIHRPYPPELRVEIEDALSGIDYLFENSKELKRLGNGK